MRRPALQLLLTLCLASLPGAGCGGGGTPGDPCDGIDCSGHGTCTAQGATARCTCEYGYEASEDGTECLPVDTGPCSGITCSGHGRCRVDEDDNAYCDCDPGYSPAADGLDCIENQCTEDCGVLGCCGTVCCEPLPSNSVILGRLQQTGTSKSAAGSFDTVEDCTAGSALGDCELVTVAGGTDVCVCRLDELRIDGGLSVEGAAALAVFAWTSIRIDGTLDISGHGADPGPGATGWQAAATSWLGGSGGSFGTAGGGGAVRGNAQLVPLVGGQDGQSGCGDRDGGGGGGAVQLSAGESITVTGAIHANGGGGRGGAAGEHPDKCVGAGGGGSGGGVLLEARSVTVSGAIWAHGGSGGGGGNNRDAAGGDGQDATASMTPAAGGAGRDGASCALYEAIEGGDGGDGGVGDGPGGEGEAPDQNMCDPDQPFVGGGGGGGGVGRIRINTIGGCDCTGTISPAYATGVLKGG